MAKYEKHDYRHKKRISSIAVLSVMNTWRERNRRHQYEKRRDKVSTFPLMSTILRGK